MEPPFIRMVVDAVIEPVPVPEDVPSKIISENIQSEELPILPVPDKVIVLGSIDGPVAAAPSSTRSGVCTSAVEAVPVPL